MLDVTGFALTSLLVYVCLCEYSVIPAPADAQHMFVDLKGLLAPGSTQQQTCQRVQSAVAAAAAGGGGYTHPMAGSCPLTGAPLLPLLLAPK